MNPRRRLRLLVLPVLAAGMLPVAGVSSASAAVHPLIAFRIPRVNGQSVTVTYSVDRPAGLVASRTCRLQLLPMLVSTDCGAVVRTTSTSTTYRVTFSGLRKGQYIYKVAVTPVDGLASAAGVNFTVPNSRPTARDDTFTRSADGRLAVATPGVLGNDTDPDGDPITAVLVKGPTHGKLALNADGSFNYVARSGFTGRDAFTYRASDGQTRSRTATVTLSVGAPPPPPPPPVVL